MMMQNDKSLNGCIVLIKGKSFLAKQIIMHMKLLAVRNNKKLMPYSHAEFLLWDETYKTLFTIGARKDGAESTLVTEYYQHIKEKDMLILYPNKPLSKDETQRLWNYFQKTDTSKYQFGNFAAWITYLKFGFWLGRKGETRAYCYELAARFANEVSRWNQKSLEMVSIYDLVENKYYNDGKQE